MAQGNQDKGGQGGKGNQGQGGQAKAERARAGSLRARTIPATSPTIARRRPRRARGAGVRNLFRKGPAQLKPGLSLSRGTKRKLLVRRRTAFCLERTHSQNFMAGGFKEKSHGRFQKAARFERAPS
mgnify:CR=1 FL=1